ncbi:nitroreductase family protein [Lacticaseibacillus pabuli]|uniref:Nitroreductase family protein n=1 Tax=Lacticaseibacillus pabuli TaxID=3025672 RepID=A0ABY7WYI9_9LACO|nr:nitroreductase family protein [Lacticaseibacillus sp. KACC 23028]WDF82990.1 nitroreductase family protein [Lacticaseibacillus sp. KACC 23028]
MDESALQHRSIRRYKDQPLTTAQINALVAVAQATASSKFMQQFSLIHISDPTLKQAIADLTTHDFVADPGDLFVFVIDQARNVALVQGSGKSIHQLTNWDALFGGLFDATLAAQNMVAAAERSGLGTVFLGSILNDPAQMIQLLHLPKYTFPLLGLKVGVPDEAPELKPRLPRVLMFAENSYPQSNAADMDAYNTQLHAYYAARSWGNKDTDYRQSMITHLAGALHHRDDIGKILRQQGFDLPE